MAELEDETSGLPSDPSGNLSAWETSMSQQVSFQDTRTKPAFDFMVKRQTYRVIINGVDFTPENIVDTDYVTMEDTFTHAAFETKQRRGKSEIISSRSKIISSRSKIDDAGMNVYATTISLDDIYIDHTYNTEEGVVETDEDLGQAPSAFYLPKMNPVTTYPPEIFVVYKETETHYLFGLPSFVYEKGSAEGAVVEEENEYYQYITVGKGRNRKMVVEETQTKQCVTQTRHTLCVRPKKKNAIAFASMWDMHDTYAQLAKIKAAKEPDEMVLYQSAAPNLLRKKKVVESDEGRGKTFEEIGQMPEFFDAALLVERVLAALEYGCAQKTFRGLVAFNPLSLDLIYIYSMTPLWSFECEETINRPITSISFNAKNPNILAVAHGKFVYAEDFTGLVCIWCTKNPCKPERTYRFEVPVTSVSFSDKNPNWLACGFDNGDVMILDITSYTVKTVAMSKRDTNPCFEPIWVTNWRMVDMFSEYVMTACQDGRINRFTSTKTHDFICTPMMRLSTVEGKLKGLQIAKICLKVDVPITRYPAALCMIWHPHIDHVYYVGTDEGCIHRCSTHYLNQHIDVFRAHAGPVYAISVSPFMKNLMVSCGADNAIRLWLEGMDDVILTLTCPAAVYAIAFCPINATVLISASGNVLSVWDLRRKTHMPCAEYSFASNVTLTYVQFTPSGDNVIVGDSSGRVHTYHLEDTPIPPFYQYKMLDETLKKALCTRPHLLKQLQKLEKFRERYK